MAIELAVAVAGGFSALALMFAYGSELWFRPVLYTVILMVGTLVGIEIPLLMRILKDEVDFKDLLAKVLAFDYVGALLIAVVFPWRWCRAWGWCARPSPSAPSTPRWPCGACPCSGTGSGAP